MNIRSTRMLAAAAITFGLLAGIAGVATVPSAYPDMIVIG